MFKALITAENKKSPIFSMASQFVEKVRKKRKIDDDSESFISSKVKTFIKLREEVWVRHCMVKSTAPRADSNTQPYGTKSPSNAERTRPRYPLHHLPSLKKEGSRTMAEAAVEQIECGFCLRKEGVMENPKTLPCTHIHCLECLTDNYHVGGIVVVLCPFCREVFDVALESLPSANVREDNSLCCDVCLNKGEDNQPAATYCTVCTAKYCTKHKGSHDDLHLGHVKLTIDEYRIQAKKLQPRMCTVHKELQYSIGCRSCLTVICVGCIDEQDVCTDGGAHKMLSIDKLVAELTTEIDNMRAEVIDKEENLSALFKLTSRIISEFDTETEKMIQTLHETRDEQVEAICQKYKTLEDELLELRKSARSSMAQFMEEDVGIRWSDLNKHRLQIVAEFKHNHQVDFVNIYEDTRRDIQKLISEELPTLELRNMVTLEVKDQRRGLEVEVVVRESTFISLEGGLTTTAPLPKSMTLLQTVQVSDCSHSAYHYQGNTYVGICKGTVDKIDGSYQLSESLLTVNGCVLGITVYKDRVYTLVHDHSTYTVTVHDLTGRLLTNWTHTGQVWLTVSKLAIVENQIVIPNRQNKQLSVYSLTGEVIKHLPCPLLSSKWVSICAAETNSVVISDLGSSEVFKVNISTGDIIWTVKHMTNPQGVTCYKSRVFVASGGTTTRVWILDEKTGKLLKELSDPAERFDSNVFDLQISGNTLIVPRGNEKQVLFYELN